VGAVQDGCFAVGYGTVRYIRWRASTVYGGGVSLNAPHAVHRRTMPTTCPGAIPTTRGASQVPQSRVSPENRPAKKTVPSPCLSNTERVPGSGSGITGN